MADSSKLIQDLTKVPNIVGGLGLSVASAQRAFDLNYVENLERIIIIIKQLLDPHTLDAAGKPVNLTDADMKRFEQFAGVLKDMLGKMAPSRYQFTETTLKVHLDLAQSLDASMTAGLGFGMGGLAVNAAFSIGYSYDYRAAAEVSTVIHAYPADPTVFKTLLERAKEIGAKDLALPERSDVDKAFLEQTDRTFEAMVGVKPEPVKTK